MTWEETSREARSSLFGRSDRHEITTRKDEGGTACVRTRHENDPLRSTERPFGYFLCSPCSCRRLLARLRSSLLLFALHSLPPTLITLSSLATTSQTEWSVVEPTSILDSAFESGVFSVGTESCLNLYACTREGHDQLLRSDWSSEKSLRP